MKSRVPGLLLLLAVTFQVSAWGPTGHRVTGCIAEKYLSKKARNAIEKILNGQSIAMASTWMDEIRSDPTYDYMADWHWVTIAEDENYDQSLKNPNGDILGTLERVVRELKARKMAADQEAQFLKILIHLTADLHQPLHVGARDDRGGNNIHVKWFGENSNLHRVWDSDMIDNTRLSYTEFARAMETPSEDQIRKWQGASIYEWARESQSYDDQVYNVGNKNLGYAYSYVNLPIVRQRLLQAGVRLAGILNEIYG